MVSGGKGATLRLRYAEKLRDPKRVAGNRNEIAAKELTGNEDLFLADGGARRLFRPLCWGTYRYVQLNVKTAGDQPSFCRAPSSLPLCIPSFSLWWIGMLHDYFPYQDHPTFVKWVLPGSRDHLLFRIAPQRRRSARATAVVELH